MAEQTTKDESLNPTGFNSGSKTLANETTPSEVKPPAESEKSDSGKGANAANPDPTTGGSKGAGKTKRAYTPRKKRDDAVGQGSATVTTSTAAKDATAPLEVALDAVTSGFLKEAHDKIFAQTDIPIPYAKLTKWAFNKAQLDEMVAKYCRLTEPFS